MCQVFKHFLPGTVAHTVIQATQEVEIRRIMVQDQPEEKVVMTLISSSSWEW
jgi:hypothetical protein